MGGNELDKDRADGAGGRGKAANVEEAEMRLSPSPRSETSWPLPDVMRCPGLQGFAPKPEATGS